MTPAPPRIRSRRKRWERRLVRGLDDPVVVGAQIATPRAARKDMTPKPASQATLSCLDACSSTGCLLRERLVASRRDACRVKAGCGHHPPPGFARRAKRTDKRRGDAKPEGIDHRLLGFDRSWGSDCWQGPAPLRRGPGQLESSSSRSRPRQRGWVQLEVPRFDTRDPR